jgi:hypothetical protein
LNFAFLIGLGAATETPEVPSREDDLANMKAFERGLVQELGRMAGAVELLIDAILKEEKREHERRKG